MAGNGFDFLSFTGIGKEARLFINEVKDYTSHAVKARNFTAFGLGARGEKQLIKNIAEAVQAINVTVR